MKYLQKPLLVCRILAALIPTLTSVYNGLEYTTDSYNHGLPKLLAEIYKESPFNTVFLILSNEEENHHHNTMNELYQITFPKIIMGKGSENFIFKDIFNSEIIAVIFMPANWDPGLFDYLAQTLDYMRQTRILVITHHNGESYDNKFLSQLLQGCEKNKFTKILLVFMDCLQGIIISRYNLRPYPQYNWSLGSSESPLYTQNWKNMQRRPIVIYVEQVAPRTYLYLDQEGDLQLSGPWNKLVLLFAERFNATLKLYKIPVLDKSTFYTHMVDVVEQNLVDIPITIDEGHRGSWRMNTAAIEVTRVELMVPCPLPFSTGEIYMTLLNGKFFGFLFLSSLIFSLLHSLIDWIFEDLRGIWNFILNDKAVPSILGQSFMPSKLPNRSLKILYILMFINGLVIGIQFAVRIKSLLTTPPYHKHIDNYDELNHVGLPILATETVYREPPYPVKNMIITKNNTFFQTVRQNFNTSYGYFMTSTVWQTFKRQQQSLTYKIFCVYDNLTIASPHLFSLRLQKDSEYKEPFDYLIHRMHDLGLMEAWHTYTFSDMLKMKEISLLRPKQNEGGPKALFMEDLYWLWLIIIGGLVLSALNKFSANL
ncbi:uncharacterized protein LOC142224455 [Haematobia irritans]|uniref:uncharacterized protein LOC142224455 n=1 Tax=Haematobia irritans TaxID=7368 RepID=UPI003F4F6410